ncbi:Zn-ribbon domain-containing OB-fold protein [Sphingomonas populi]|uniref:Zn-ribbon domain-containing OB-fold protein n=1 Tax=Sphingomonas populi TaxID=2484750 RepID=A0A4Q6XVP2_9SPHN|nr:Zn-ribbon domain-containing OB-fold protein [Sphingomonas populi]RZF64743.1 Zn-ribbon domain-containing OB-fold protein [Sphingomonas populi]
MQSPYNKPLPVPDSESTPFWDGMREGKLVLQRCASSGDYLFPPVTFCPGSLERPEWVAASGKGTVFSWITVRHPVPRDIYAGDVPYVVAIVALDEGCRMTGNLVGCTPEAVRAGMPVEIVFNRVTPEITLPAFRPVGD